MARRDLDLIPASQGRRLPLPLARALRNVLCGSEVRFQAFFERDQAAGARWAGPFSRPGGGGGAMWSCCSPCGPQHRPSFEVHGEAEKVQMGLIARQSQ